MTKLCNLGCVKLDKPIALQAVTRTSDGQGGWTEVWNTVANDWAQITPKRGREQFGAQQMLTPVRFEVMLRYRDDVTSAMRFTYNERVFEIKEILNLEEANVYLMITAVEMT